MFINDDMYGLWNYNLTYKGLTYEYPFQLKASQSIRDDDEEIMAEVYPIPATKEVWITLSGTNAGCVEYFLTDLIGRILISGNLHLPVQKSLQLDLSDFREGVYLLTIKSKNDAETWKIIRQ